VKEKEDEGRERRVRKEENQEARTENGKEQVK
jgi:hypothetical protein